MTLHVRGIEHGELWVVTQEGDPTPIGRHATRAEAEADARTFGETFGHEHVIVHELDGEEVLYRIPDPAPQPPYPGGAKGPPAG